MSVPSSRGLDNYFGLYLATLNITQDYTLPLAMFAIFQSWLSRRAISTASDCTLPTFEYESLPANKKCFRIFHLEPRDRGDRSHDLDGVIRGHLSIVFLDQTTDTKSQYEYDALSYRWEDSIEANGTSNSNDKDTILLRQELEDGTQTATSQFTISRALSTALRYLRAQAANARPLPMFIDQICINQGDSDEAKTEKGQQINLMADIYRHSARVVAWLGVGTAQTDAFFDFAAKLNHHPCESLIFNSERSAAVFSVAMPDGSNDLYDADEVLQRDMPQMRALARRYWPEFPHRGALEVYLRRWFRRIWIVQEACLAPDIIFVCGWKSCSVREFGSAITFHRLAKTLWSWEGGPPPPPCPEDNDGSSTSHIAHQALQCPSRILHERWRTWRRLSAGASQNQPQELAGLVTRFNVDIAAQGSWVRLGSSKPHDYIYALKGLASESDHVAAGLVPNYHASASTAFTDFTRLIINPSIDTLLLSQRETKRLKNNLPSWVPDYSAEKLALPRGYRPGCVPMFAAGWPGGDSSRGQPQLDMRTRPEILRARGIVLCEIDVVGAHSMELPPPTTRESRYMHIYLGIHMAFPLPWGSRNLIEASRTPLPTTMFPYFRQVKEFCELAAAAARSAHAAGSTSTCSSFPTLEGEEGARRGQLDEAVWLTTTGGHGLPSNIEQSPLGPTLPSFEDFHYGQEEDEEEKPLLGRLWDLQLSADVLPTIMRRRRTSLVTLASAYYTAAGTQESSHNQWFQWLRAALVYLAGRMWIEARHVLWCYRFFVVYPFTPVTTLDHLFWGVLREKRPPRGYDLGLLHSVLKRHIGRACFRSAAGHVGLVPAAAKEAGKKRSVVKLAVQESDRDGDKEQKNKLGAISGDLVVVLLGLSAPIVLRPGATAADPYTYVGEAYCHGFMNGEALRGKVDADMQWFEIE